MATGAGIPSCGSCKNPYKYGGPEPFLLPCLHSVCKNCLDSDVDDTVFCTACREYFLKVENNFPVSCHECLFRWEDVCPSCTKCTQTDGHRRLYFPKDSVTAKTIFMTTAEHFSSELLCTNRDDGNQAMSWCQKCDAFLCEHCQASHEEMKATRSHAIVSVKDLALSESNVEGYEHQDICSVHDGYPLELYDQQCNVLICYKCKEEHKDCNIKPVEEEMKRIKAEMIEVQVNTLNEKLEKNIETETGLKGIENTLEETRKVLGERVKHTFEELKCRLNQREEEIKIQMTQIMDHLTEQNSEKLKTLYVDRAACETALTFNKNCLGVCSNSGLLDMEKSIDSRNTACLIKTLPQVQCKTTSISFSTEGLPLLRKATAEFGGFYTRLNDATDASRDNEYVCVPKKTLRALEEENTLLRALLTSKENGHYSEILSNIKVKPFHLDKKRANKAKVQVIDDQTLVNWLTPEKSRTEEDDSDGENKLLNFRGTTSTRPLSTDDIEYWEVHADVDITKELPHGKLVIEIGFASANAIDTKHNVSREPDSVVLYVINCDTHDKMCVKVRKDSRRSHCFECLLTNTPGKAETLKYGILTNPQRKQCTFIDLVSNKILCYFSDINFDLTMWPIFGVFNKYLLNAEVRCVCGDKIQTKMDKSILISSALH